MAEKIDINNMKYPTDMVYHFQYPMDIYLFSDLKDNGEYTGAKKMSIKDGDVVRVVAKKKKGGIDYWVTDKGYAFMPSTAYFTKAEAADGQKSNDQPQSDNTSDLGDKIKSVQLIAYGAFLLSALAFVIAVMKKGAK